jgi:hypothetical protein
LEVLRKDAYPEPAEIGGEEGVSPDVYLSGLQGRIDERTARIEGGRELAKGTGKMAIYGQDKGWWDLTPGKFSRQYQADKIRGKFGGMKKGASALASGGKEVAANFGAGFTTKAGNMLNPAAAGEVAKYGMGADASATFAAKAGAAVPPLLLAYMVSKAAGYVDDKTGGHWRKGTNKGVKKFAKDLGFSKKHAGRTKNLLSPWKWRL